MQIKYSQMKPNGDLWIPAVIGEWVILKNILNLQRNGKEKPKMSIVINSLFAGVVTIYFSSLSQDILQTSKNLHNYHQV